MFLAFLLPSFRCIVEIDKLCFLCGMTKSMHSICEMLGVSRCPFDNNRHV